MAGEIYIADKQTLDSVKQDTQALLNKSSGSIDGLKYRAIEMSDIKINLTTILDISGSGWLKTAVIYGDGEGHQIKITVDGTMIYGTNPLTIASRGSAYDYRVFGIARMKCSQDYDYGKSTYYDTIEGIRDRITVGSYTIPKAGEFPSSVLKSFDQYSPGCLYLTGEMIKFKTSLKIEVMKKPSGGCAVVEYYLD